MNKKTVIKVFVAVVLVAVLMTAGACAFFLGITMTEAPITPFIISLPINPAPILI